MSLPETFPTCCENVTQTAAGQFVKKKKEKKKEESCSGPTTSQHRVIIMLEISRTSPPYKRHLPCPFPTIPRAASVSGDELRGGGPRSPHQLDDPPHTHPLAIIGICLNKLSPMPCSAHFAFCFSLCFSRTPPPPPPLLPFLFFHPHSFPFTVVLLCAY